MTLHDLTLALRNQMGDNRAHVESAFWETLSAIMSEDRQSSSKWRTMDQARLTELVDRCREGDLDATKSVYELFKRPVFNLAYRHTMNAAAAEDILQDVFLKVFSRLGDVRDIKTFPGWIFRIALNTCYTYLRQKRAQEGKVIPLNEIEGRVDDAKAVPVERDLRGTLNEAIQTLPNRLKSVFVLHDVQGFKHREISNILGCSVGTSKSQLFKARLKLRDYLKAKKIV